MCSVNEDTECEDLLLNKNASLRKSTTCRSCDSPGLVNLRGKDVYCRKCFLNAETHKFRAAIGKSKMMNPNDKVLVGYSCSESSCALLHMLHSGVMESTHKKLLFDVIILFIDEGAIFKKNIEERQEIVNAVKKQTLFYNFPLFITTLSEYFSEEPSIGHCLKISKELDQQLIYLFENVKSVTSKEDLLRLAKQYLLLKCAEWLKCNKIFTAEVGTDLAIKLLSCFSLGRGNQVSFETGFCDSRQNVKILRPMQDFTRKEIVFYNKFHKIQAMSFPSVTTLLPANITIQKLTEKFVLDLQESFPSTVYTVFRTGEKLSVNKDQTGVPCLLCKDQFWTNCQDKSYTAMDAANFSRNISDKSYCEVKKGSHCSSCPDKKSIKINRLILAKFLCYGCGVIVKDLESIDHLPKRLLQSAVERSDLNFMREQISEFLIED